MKLDSDGIKIKEEIKDTFSELKELIYYSEDELKSYYLDTKKYVEVIIEIIKMLDERVDGLKGGQHSDRITL